MLQKISFSFQNLSFSKKVLSLIIASIIFSFIFAYWFGKIYLFIFKPVFIGQLFNPFPQDRSAIFIGFFSAFLFSFPFLVFLFLPKKQINILLKGSILPFSLFIVNGWQDTLFALGLVIIGILLGKFLLTLRTLRG